jgi:hypothetical protein
VTHSETLHWIVSAGLAVLAFWNRIGLRSLSLSMDGLRVQWMKTEKALSYTKGVANDQIGEDIDSENIK